MQGRGTIIGLTVIIAVISFFELRFTFLADKIESEARVYAEAKTNKTYDEASPADRLLIEQAEAKYLDSVAEIEVGFMGDTYNQIKEKELNLGLDLQGGLSVTLEVPIKRILNSLSNSKKDPDFKRAIELADKKQESSDLDYIALFEEAWNEVAPGKNLAGLFANKNNIAKINATSTNELVISHLADEVETVIANTEHILRTRIDGLGLKSPNITRAAGSERITVELAGAKNPDEIKRWLQSSAKLEFWETYFGNQLLGSIAAGDQELFAKEEAKKEIEGTDNEVATVETEGDDPLAAVEGDELLGDLESDTTSLDNDLETAEPKTLIFQYMAPIQQGGTALIGRAKVVDTARINVWLKSKEVKNKLPKDCRLLWSSTILNEAGDNVVGLYGIKYKSTGPRLDGNSVVDAQQSYDEYGKPDVSMGMNDYGRKVWKKMTAQAVREGNKAIAIVLDNQIVSAPTVNVEIKDGRSSITGGFTTKVAKDFANILQSGKLPAKPEIIEESVVGPTLGAESVSTSLKALIAGLLLVLVFMVIYYHKAGSVADMALFLNLFFIIGILAGYGATLTLPGMAGLVLTIGMSVDANVIIFERIREEIRRGLDFKAAISSGFKNSYSAIIDANITTLLTGIVLAYFGAGPVKGFATVLIIGIITSFFTAVLVTRVILQRSIDKNKEVKFETNFSKGILANANWNFIGMRKKAYIISSIVILLGVGSMFTKGFELGVEFNGGREYGIEFAQSVSTDQLKDALDDDFSGSDVIVKSFGADNKVKVTTNFLHGENNNEADSTVKSKLAASLMAFGGDDNGFTFLSERKAGPSIADDFQRSSRTSTIFGIIVVFLYIFARFSKLQFGLGAIIAIFHDVLIVLAMFSIFKGLLPFDLEISQAFVAALLTVIGYSINDTVVIFDRIREYFNRGTKQKASEIINSAVNNTLSRTVMTTTTTFIVVAILLVFGSSEIQGFAFALLIGIISGTYSSIFIATPMIIDLDFSGNLEEDLKKDAEKKQVEMAESAAIKA